MESIYKKKPFFVLQRRWDTKTVHPKVYTLQSNGQRNKYKAEIYKDDSLLGIKFTLNKTISEFIHASEKLNLYYVTSFFEFGNVLLGRHQTNWKQVLHKHFPEPVDLEVAKPVQDCTLAENFLRAIDLFLIQTLNKTKPRERQYNYLMPGGDHGVYKELLTSPLDHLHCFEDMLCITKLLPKGDLSPPNAALQVEWFYMSFHFLDHTEYVRSGRKLCNETLQTLAEYFESIFLAWISNGSIQRKYNEQLCSAAKHELCHKLKEHYREKLKRLWESQERHSSRRWRDKRDSRSTGNCRPTCYGDHCHFKACSSGYKDSCRECKPPPEDGKFNKPCHLHGTDSKHSYESVNRTQESSARKQQQQQC